MVKANAIVAESSLRCLGWNGLITCSYGLVARAWITKLSTSFIRACQVPEKKIELAFDHTAC
jgi:hypothetical protein